MPRRRSVAWRASPLGLLLLQLLLLLLLLLRKGMGRDVTEPLGGARCQARVQGWARSPRRTSCAGRRARIL